MSELEATLPSAADVPAPSAPTFADQVAAIDAIEVASRIVSRGTRAAIGASAHEIVAMAHRLIHLTTLADLTLDMLMHADLTLAEKQPDQRRRLSHALRLKIGDVGATLEALGYGDAQLEALGYGQTETPGSQKENTDGQG